MARAADSPCSWPLIEPGKLLAVRCGERGAGFGAWPFRVIPEASGWPGCVIKGVGVARAGFGEAFQGPG